MLVPWHSRVESNEVSCQPLTVRHLPLPVHALWRHMVFNTARLFGRWRYRRRKHKGLTPIRVSLFGNLFLVLGTSHGFLLVLFSMMSCLVCLFVFSLTCIVPAPGISVEVRPENLRHFNVMLSGPRDTPFQGSLATFNTNKQTS